MFRGTNFIEWLELRRILHDMGFLEASRGLQFDEETDYEKKINAWDIFRKTGRWVIR